jgi:isopenicillin-N epimerase
MNPKYSPLSRHWQLDESMTFLNHGSFGATPVKVLEKQNELRNQAEAELVRFYIREMEDLWDNARLATAEFLGSKPYNLVFVKNTTMGVNTILHSLKFKEGDELLTTSQAYGACVNMLKWYCDRFKLNLIIADTPFPLKNEDEIVEAIAKKITPKTKFALIDHITSPTGIIFPVGKITRLLQSKNIEVLIDGAHAPGMIDLDLEKLNADYYVGNCHKWICSPKGSAVLWVREDHHHKIFPLQISHAYDKPVERKLLWAKSFFWPGTDDYSAYLCLPDAIRFMGEIFTGGWEELRKHNRDLTLKGRKLISEKLNIELPAPENMIGHLGTMIIGKTELPPNGFNVITPLQEALFSSYKIEVPVFVYPRHNPQLCLRIACQAYNDISQIEYLAESVRQIWQR